MAVLAVCAALEVLFRYSIPDKPALAVMAVLAVCAALEGLVPVFHS